MLEPRRDRKRVAAALALLLAVLLAAACGTSNGKKAVPVVTPSPTPTPAQTLNAAADRVQALSAFHFLLTHENGGSPIALGLTMTRAEGDFQNPNRFRATVNATFGSIPVTVKVINIGAKTWITNPLQSGDHYQDLPNGTQATAILDPNHGIINAARTMMNPQYAGTALINGVQTREINGTIDAGKLQSLDANAKAGMLVNAGVWVGTKDGLVYRVRLVGPLTTSEPKNIARQIDLSLFNESIDIQPPVVGG